MRVSSNFAGAAPYSAMILLLLYHMTPCTHFQTK